MHQGQMDTRSSFNSFMYVAVLLLLRAALAKSAVNHCPNGLPIVKCFADPCRVTKCPAYPDATCVSNYCGGCNARFYDLAGNDVTKSCNCPVKGQVVKRCASIFPATCTNPSPSEFDICGRNKCECPKGQVINNATNKCVPFNECPICPPDVPIVNCFINPCLNAQCPAHPEAVCTPDFCGGCNKKFIDSNGIDVTSSCGGTVDSSMFNDEEY